ncbi:MAG: electron transfer flavoprotein subunit beta/FixA family protein [Proteobacteria bacterium]|nr:electron transfer flavoprotein subunit beta/FixA family protein [Pseudomonadota bacterium]
MKIVVAVKRVIDPYVKIRVKADNSGVETANVKMSMNPFDEIALEEAIRLVEKGLASEVTVVSIGSETTQETLRHALALGAANAILVRTDEKHCSLNIAKILQKIVEDEKPNLVLMGKQAIDGDNNQTPQMLAALLNWPQATFASQLSLNDKNLEVTREIDGGLETIAMQLPAVVSVDLRLNEPRYASLPNIMKSKSKPLKVIELEHLSLNLKKHIEIVSVNAPKVRTAGLRVENVEELIAKLKHEAKVL